MISLAMGRAPIPCQARQAPTPSFEAGAGRSQACILAARPTNTRLSLIRTGPLVVDFRTQLLALCLVDQPQVVQMFDERRVTKLQGFGRILSALDSMFV